MKVLISAGANLYVQRNDGFTALHVAAKNNQPKIAEVLVEAMDDLGVQEVGIDEVLLPRRLDSNYNGRKLQCRKKNEVVDTMSSLASGVDLIKASWIK